MKNNRRVYLFTLEVAPLNIGEVYNPLPSHLTLVSRFWSSLPHEELAQGVSPVLKRAHPIELVFDKTALLGPQKVTAHLIKVSDDLKSLHLQLSTLLSSRGVTFTAPEWVGKGFRPHVTARKGAAFATGYTQLATAVYLIEVQIHADDHLRFVRAKFDLK